MRRTKNESAIGWFDLSRKADNRMPDTDKIVEELHRLYPDADCALEHRQAHELLFGTIMSAQTTDVNVNRVTSTLYRKYRTVADFAAADPAVFEKEIRPTGFFRNKTRSVLGAATMLMEEFDGQVPDTMEELLRLPGVARKTANVVLGTFFGKAEGIVVDTHVKRLSFRMGFTTETNPVKIERDLMEHIPQNEWIFVGHALILHGRAVCTARNPKCSACTIREYCHREGLLEHE
jgi:endonuclease III